MYSACFFKGSCITYNSFNSYKVVVISTMSEFADHMVMFMALMVASTHLSNFAVRLAILARHLSGDLTIQPRKKPLLLIGLKVNCPLPQFDLDSQQNC